MKLITVTVVTMAVVLEVLLSWNTANGVRRSLKAGYNNVHLPGVLYPGEGGRSFSLWVNFDEEENPSATMPPPPSSDIDPTTGCPFGFTCSNALPPVSSMDPCQPHDMTQFCIHPHPQP